MSELEPTVVAFSGELTIHTLTEQRARMLEAGAAVDLIFDLSGITELDGAGLQLLVAAKRQRLAAGQSLRLTGHSRRIREAMERCGLAGFFGDPQIITAAECE